MRLYRGDISKYYTEEVWPLGAISQQDGNVYKFVKATGEAKIKKYDAVLVDVDNTATLASSTGDKTIVGVVPIDVYIPASTTYYFWVQIDGVADVATTENNTTDVTGKPLVPSSTAGSVAQYSNSFDAASDGAPTDAELQAGFEDILEQTFWALKGLDAVGYSDADVIGDVDATVSYTHSTTTVSGSGTYFTRWFVVGDIINIAGTDLTITGITDDETMAVSGGSVDIASTNNFTRKRKVVTVKV